jgi:hypothetical protein
LLSLTSYHQRALRFANTTDAAVDGAFDAVGRMAKARRKRVAGFKAGGPGMAAVCGCTEFELLARAHAHHGARVIFLLRQVRWLLPESLRRIGHAPLRLGWACFDSMGAHTTQSAHQAFQSRLLRERHADTLLPAMTLDFPLLAGSHRRRPLSRVCAPLQCVCGVTAR